MPHIAAGSNSKGVLSARLDFGQINRMPLQLISALGIILILFVSWAISSNRKRFPWRTVIWGVALQFDFALLY